MDTTLRKPKTQARYEAYLKTPEAKGNCFKREMELYEAGLPSQIVKEYKYFYLMPNEFPYDLMYEQHDLLFCKRLVEKPELMHKEKLELESLELEFEPKDLQIIKNCGVGKSQYGFHLHICKPIRK